MASPTTGRSSARKSKPDRRPAKQGANKPAKKKRGGNPKGKGHRSRTSWKKGRSGNYKGRPKKGETFSDIIRSLAVKKDVTTPDGKKIPRKVAVVEGIYTKAIIERDLPAAKFLIERVDPPAGEEPPDGPTHTAAQVWAAVIAMVRKATEGHPEVRAKIVKEINAAYPGD